MFLCATRYSQGDWYRVIAKEAISTVNVGVDGGMERDLEDIRVLPCLIVN